MVQQVHNSRHSSGRGNHRAHAGFCRRANADFGTNIIQFLSLSFEGPAKWFFLGYIFYMILVVAIAVRLDTLEEKNPKLHERLNSEGMD